VAVGEDSENDSLERWPRGNEGGVNEKVVRKEDRRGGARGLLSLQRRQGLGSLQNGS